MEVFGLPQSLYLPTCGEGDPLPFFTAKGGGGLTLLRALRPPTVIRKSECHLPRKRGSIRIERAAQVADINFSGEA